MGTFEVSDYTNITLTICACWYCQRGLVHAQYYLFPPKGRKDKFTVVVER